MSGKGNCYDNAMVETFFKTLCDEAPPGTTGTGENICPKCRGSGRVGQSRCPDCGGTGKVVEGIGGA
jgi:transposase InsO family protein